MNKLKIKFNKKNQTYNMIVNITYINKTSTNKNFKLYGKHNFVLKCKCIKYNFPSNTITTVHNCFYI